MHSKDTCNHQGDWSAIVKFVVVVFALGTLAQVGAIHSGLRQGGSNWLLLTMWVPAVAAFTVSRASRRMAWAAVKRTGWRWLLPGFVVGIAPQVVKVVLLALSGTGAWDAAHFELSPDGSSIAAIHKLGVVLGAGEQSFAVFALNLFLSVSMGSIVVALIGGIGEELGWRGFLQPALERRLGSIKGTILVGLIWAYWHLPANLMGYNDGQHPLLNALLLFPMIVVGMSFGFAWLTRRSGSAWPAALAHGANNTIGTAFLLTPKTWSAGAITEIVSMTIVATFFVWAALKRRGTTALIIPGSSTAGLPTAPHIAS